MTEIPNRPIEMGVALDTGTWETCIVEIPADTAEADIFRVAQDVVIGSDTSARQISLGLSEDCNGNVNITGTWVYNSMDDDCPELPPHRSEVVVRLSFDTNQTTVGSEIEQQDAAIDQINLTLQREPYGLGARLDAK